LEAILKKRVHFCVQLILAVLCVIISTLAFGQAAQTPVQPSVVPGVPRLVKFSGLLPKDASGNVLTNTTGIAFAVYSEQTGGVPLWQETHNVQFSQGHYTVFLGESTSGGIPAELFASGQPRWLGVRALLPGEEEQPRVLLASVPYALKAVDADTLGGLPASAYLRAETGVPVNIAVAPTNSASSGTQSVKQLTSFTVTTSGGRIGTIPVFHTATDVENSPIVDSAGTISITAPLTVSGLSTLAGATAQSVNGVLNPASCGASAPPAWCSGSELGAWINAAIAEIGCGTIEIPVASVPYGFTTTIRKPRCIVLTGQGGGTQLTYSGSSAAIVVADALGTNNYFDGGLRDLYLTGPGYGTSTIGIFCGGDPLNVLSPSGDYCDLQKNYNVTINQFGNGIKFGNNAFLNDFYSLDVFTNATSIWVPSGLSNSGEHITFHGGYFTATSTVFENDGGAMISFFGSSFDSLSTGTTAWSGSNLWGTCYSCHFEAVTPTTFIAGTNTGNVNIIGGEMWSNSSTGSTSQFVLISGSNGGNLNLDSISLASNNPVTQLVNWTASITGGEAETLNITNLRGNGSGEIASVVNSALLTPATEFAGEYINVNLSYPIYSVHVDGSALRLARGLTVGSGGNIVYRCTSAGTLPVGALTVKAADCGASTTTALTVN
jgi:hypothetical protein